MRQCGHSAVGPLPQDMWTPTSVCPTVGDSWWMGGCSLGPIQLPHRYPGKECGCRGGRQQIAGGGTSSSSRVGTPREDFLQLSPLPQPQGLPQCPGPTGGESVRGRHISRGTWLC